MDYQELTFTTASLKNYGQDLLIDALAQIGFDSFEETDQGFKAYIPWSTFDQTILDNTLNQTLISFEEDPSAITYSSHLIPHTNWNQAWESNFEPITIGKKCYVRATFHEPHPEYPHELIIDPKMAFGTGHHQTTALMMEMMLEHVFEKRAVLDMGCGTGILAILASKLGASPIAAIDCDEMCITSVQENLGLNQVENVTTYCGSKEAIPNQHFDIILANINRNILLDQLANYSESLVDGGLLFLSGFYQEPDLPILIKEGHSNGLKYITHSSSENWVAAKFIKNGT